MYTGDAYGVWDERFGELVTTKGYCSIMGLEYATWKKLSKLLYFRKRDATACANRLNKAYNKTSVSANLPRFKVVALMVAAWEVPAE